jgi:hypothetical protein
MSLPFNTEQRERITKFSTIVRSNVSSLKILATPPKHNHLQSEILSLGINSTYSSYSPCQSFQQREKLAIEESSKRTDA